MVRQTGAAMNTALDAALAAGQAAKLDCRDARVIRARSSAIIELPRAKVMARVEPPEQEECASGQVETARFYEQRGAPTARLAPLPLQPFLHPGGAVTLWERLEAVDEVLSPRGFGVLLRSLHAAAGPPFPQSLPRIDPFSRIRIDQARPGPGFQDDELAALRERTGVLERAWKEVAAADPLGLRLTHGDAHAENVIVTGKGPRFLDLELAGVGPASWDLAASAVATRRYGQPPKALKEIYEGYGEDPEGWAGFDVLCQTYELLLVAWVVACCGKCPELLDEANLRISSLLDRETRPWTLR